MSDFSLFTPERPLVLVGCGNMGRALATGWLAAGLAPTALVVVDPVADQDCLPKGAEGEGVYFTETADDLVGRIQPRALVLAVKPQMMNEVLPALNTITDGETLVVSVAAGVTLAQLQRGLKDETDGTAKCVRAMPNTPAAVGAGITGLVAGAGVYDADKELATHLMQAAGKTLWLEDEALMDAVTGVSGSGPAYVFHMVEALAAAGHAAGLDAEDATILARQTIIGAAHLMEAEPDVEAGTLRTRVTSPGGTTAAALEVLMAKKDGLTGLMTRAVAAAKKRGTELAG